MKKKLILVPYPKKLSFAGCEVALTEEYIIHMEPDEKDKIFPIAKRLKKIILRETGLALPIIVGNNICEDKVIAFKKCPALPPEGCEIKAGGNGVRIRYQSAAGAFYAVGTLGQMLRQCAKRLPSFVMEDSPDYKVRGVLFDISRDKIPTMQALFEFVDFMAELKFNHLELYIEGFSFAYPSFLQVWKAGTPMTGEELIALDRYCKNRFIELVPCQNSFGHMTKWLERKEFGHLAESPEGFVNAAGKHEPAGTLNPLNPDSLDLVAAMMDDLLPYFSSKYFNVGCDEPFELGMGKSRDACEISGLEHVYLDFILKIHALSTARCKRMLFWGDIIINHPALIKELPKDMVAMEWGYEGNHPFDENCQKYSDAGIPFYVCPGTSSWKSISGRTENMKRNIVNAAVNGKKHGAEGLVVTDWGDNGHWQYPAVSYAGFVYAAGLSWNVQDKDMDIAAYLDEFILMDISKTAAKILMDLGNCYLLESHRPFNRTCIAGILYTDLYDMSDMEGFDESVFANIENRMEDIQKRFGDAHLQCKDAALVNEELRNACRLILHGVKRGKLKCKLGQGVTGIPLHDSLLELIAGLDEIMLWHAQLWLPRNRTGGLEDSLEWMRKLERQYKELL